MALNFVFPHFCSPEVKQVNIPILHHAPVVRSYARNFKSIFANQPEYEHLSLSRFLSGMMRLSHHNTVTGGTTHGRCTVHRPTVPPDGVPGFHQPDARRVSAAGPALRDRVPRPDGGMADGWETADRAPVYRRAGCKFSRVPTQL